MRNQWSDDKPEHLPRSCSIRTMQSSISEDGPEEKNFNSETKHAASYKATPTRYEETEDWPSGASEASSDRLTPAFSSLTQKLAQEVHRLSKENEALKRSYLESEIARLRQENRALTAAIPSSSSSYFQQPQPVPIDPNYSYAVLMPVGMPTCDNGGMQGGYMPYQPPRQNQIPSQEFSPWQSCTWNHHSFMQSGMPQAHGAELQDASDTQRTASRHQRRAAAKAKQVANQQDEFAIDLPEELRTTVMLRNLPNNYNRAIILKMLDDEGFQGRYDFLYLPIDFMSCACLGYAFVNLTEPSIVPEFWRIFNGFNRWILPSRKVCHVSWSGPHQGFEAHVELYRSSPVMHHSVHDDYKPIIFKDGQRIPFPPPLKAPRAPRVRHHKAFKLHWSSSLPLQHPVMELE
jgi:hypothetical protein